MEAHCLIHGRIIRLNGRQDALTRLAAFIHVRLCVASCGNLFANNAASCGALHAQLVHRCLRVSCLLFIEGWQFIFRNQITFHYSLF